jgi:hypothetical protein
MTGELDEAPGLGETGTSENDGLGLGDADAPAPAEQPAITRAMTRIAAIA